jgi:peptidyl-prolyl cis-trans isomerase A (cyclophilin A)
MIEPNGGAEARVRLVTELGDLVMQVYVERAPRSGGAFLRCVAEARFAGARFVRAVRADNDHGTPKIAVIQAAIAAASAAELSVEHESTAATGIRHTHGAVSLGRREPGAASPTQFFICVGDQPALDCGGGRAPDGQGFAAFGRIVEGIEVVRRIHGRPTVAEAADPYLRGQMMAESVAIHSVRREDNGRWHEFAG